MTESKELKDQRIPIMMTASEVEAIDDWAFKSRIRSRGEAIRRLCQIALVFDANKNEVGEDNRRIMTLAAELMDTMLMRDLDKISEDEREVYLKYSELFEVIIRAFPSVIYLIGIGNNFKSGKDIKEIIAEAEEVIRIKDQSQLRGGKGS